MYTRCTECRTLFRVTREQLNAARGQVRCGRCGNVFDALESLEEELVLPEPTVGAEDASTSRADDLFPTADASLETEAEPEFVEARPVRTPFVFEGVRPARRRSRAAWVSLAVVLAIALAAQLVHMNRAGLALDPTYGPYISRAYEALGLPLEVEPRYDLGAFMLLHHELVTHPRDDAALHLSGVLTNTADFAQPWPVLELRLEDRFGDVVAARRLQPAEYLRNAPARGESMAANARRAIEIEFLDPGHDAVGFTVDFCVRVGGGLRCTAQNGP